MKNPVVTGYEAAAIDKAVDRVLRDLNDSEPPLNVDEVRELLKLHRKYYSMTDPSLFAEMSHSLRIGGHRISRSLKNFVQQVRNAGLRAIFDAERRRICIDEDLPKPKHRWAECHEISHSLIEWHDDYLLGDRELELSADCHETIEAEANYGAGRLLFLGDRFSDEIMSRETGIQVVRDLKEDFGNTYTSTLWRYVEQHQGAAPLLGVVTTHPGNKPQDFDPSSPCRYLIQSAQFRARFSKVSEMQLFNIIAEYCAPNGYWPRGGLLGDATCLLRDDNGERHEFSFETFSNFHETLTLGVHMRALSPIVAV